MATSAVQFVAELVERMRNPVNTCKCVICNEPTPRPVTGQDGPIEGVRCTYCYQDDSVEDLDDFPLAGRASLRRCELK